MVQHSSLPWPVCGMPAGWNIAQYLTVFVSGPFTKYAPCSPLQFFLLFSVPYPFLTANPLEIRVGIYAAAATLALISFWTINGLHPRQS